MTLCLWVLHDFKFTGPFMASRGRKRARGLPTNLHTVCSLDPKEHPGQVSNKSPKPPYTATFSKPVLAIYGG